MAGHAETRWIVPENLTDEQIAEGRKALDALAKLLARTSARACHELGISPDMDDPEVAREVMKITFDALFLSGSARPRSEGQRPRTRGQRPAPVRKPR